MRSLSSATRRIVTRIVPASALLVAGVAGAALYEPQTPDADPDLGLRRNDTAGGTIEGHVFAIAPHPRGGAIVGGDFVRTGDGTVRTHLLRVRADGTLDPDFDVAISSQGAMHVSAIATSADAIYIGGNWQRIDDVVRPSLAKLTLDGELVETWHPAGDATLHEYDDIYAIALAGDSVYVGGEIETLRLMGLAKLDAATGAIDTSWRAPTQMHDHPGEPDSGWRGSVHALLVDDDHLVVGGSFLQVARVGRKAVARVSLSAPATVSPYSVPTIGSSGVATSLALDRNAHRLYVGGRFFADSGTYDNLIRTHATTGAIDADFTPNPENAVAAMVLGGGFLYYGGRFGDAEGPHLVRTRVAGNGLTDSTWLPLPDANVRALRWQGGTARLWVGGEFVDMGAHRRNGLARFSFAGKDLMFRDGLESE